MKRLKRKTIKNRTMSRSLAPLICIMALVGILGCSGNLLSNSDSSQVNGGVGEDSSGMSVRLDALPIVNTLNAGAYEITGTCISELRNVLVTVFSPQKSLNGFCVDDKFSVVVDLRTITSESLSVKVDQGPLSVSLSMEPPVDLSPPVVTVDSPLDIFISNQDSYSLNGTCTEEAHEVFVFVGDVTPVSNPVCSSGVWSISSLDVTSLLEGSITVRAYQTDSAGNPSEEALEVINKTLIPNVLHAQSMFATAGSNINSFASQDLVWTGLTVSPEYFSINPTQNDEIVLLQGGDFRLSLTLPMQTVVQRSNVAAQVKVNSVLVQGAYSASSYVRSYSGHDSSSDHIDVILNDLNPGDVIEVQVEQEAASGVTSIITPAQIFIEPVDSLQTFVATSNALTSGSNLNAASDVQLEWGVLKSNAPYAHSATDPEEIKFNESGQYLISLTIPVESSSARSSVRASLSINGSSVPGSSARQGYLRSASGHNNASVHWQGLVSVSSGEVMEVSVARDGANGTVNFLTGQSARISIEKINTNELIHLQAQDVTFGSNWNQTSTVDWDLEIDNDSSLFTHSPLTDSDKITVNEDGNYYISYTDSLYSNSQRSAVTIDVLVNGSVSGLKCDTHYIRSASGHNKSSCSLSGYLRSLNAGDIISVGTERGGISGNTTSNDDARLLILKK